jgi:hypothetical protein
MPAPRPKDKAMAERDINRDLRAVRLIIPASISRPIMKRKRQRPMLATRER